MQHTWLLVLATVLLVSCGMPQPSGVATPASPGGTPSTGQNQPVTISFAVWEYERSVYQPLAERFMSEHPNIKVVLVPLDDIMMFEPGNNAPSNPLDQLRRVVSAADTAPSFAVTQEAFGTPLLFDLKPLMDADATFQRDDFFPGTIERYTAKGGVWALPRYHSAPLMVYNRTLFQNANLPEPRPGWTWEEALAVAERLTERSGATTLIYGFIEPSSGVLPLLELLSAQGIDVLNAAPMETDLTAPEYVAVVERLRDLYRRGVLVEPYRHVGRADDPTQLVREGRVAIWSDMTYISNDDGTRWTPDFPVGRVPFPASELMPFFTYSEGFIISGGTAHPEAAWRWIEWLSRQPTWRPEYETIIGFIPARQSVAQQTDFWRNLDPQTAEAYRWTLANSKPTPESPSGFAVMSALSQAMQTALSDPKANVREALAEAQRQMQESIAQQELTPTPKPNLNPVVVATPEPQEAPVGATTITFILYGYNPAELRRIARAFREQRPDIFVQLQPFEWTPDTPQATAATLAQTSDCFSWSGPLQSSDYPALLDLRPLIDADPAFPRDDFLPALLAYYSNGGRLYGLPYAISMRVLSYNHAAFEAAGLQPPHADWTPDDFLAAAQALTKGDGDQRQWGYIPLGGPQADLLFFVSQFGASLTVGDGKDLRPNYTDPRTVAAIRWYLDLSAVHKVTPPFKFSYRRDDPGGFETRSFELLQSGRVGMWLGYGETFENAVLIPVEGGPVPTAAPLSPVERDIRIAPLPVGKVGLPPSEVFARGLFISAKTQQAQACWEWIKFLSGDVTVMYGDMPARRSIAQSDAFLKQVPPERARMFEAFRAALAVPVRTTVTSSANAIYSPSHDSYWLFQALSNTLEKGANLEQELATAQRFATAFAECMNRDGAKAARCAKQVDPDYKGYNVEEEEMPIRPAGYVP
ncbi:MAG: extracellular solute-binding protein [Roseiflexus sp.]|nr:extracellular solute-binding protein [Roseiflexus sp.]